MKPPKLPEIFIICGPTASGKSALALDLAEKKNGVIINADSQQLYADLRILTARPGPEDEARVPHRLYGILPTDGHCSAGEWLRRARMEIDWLRAEGKTPVVVGGTGLYIKALLEGIAEIPPVSPELRAQAEADRRAMGAVAFHARLAAVDPAIAARLNPGDTQRCVRAYAVWLATGKPLSYWQNQGKSAPYEKSAFHIELLMPPRETLYAACDARVDAMLAQGALNETKQIVVAGTSPDALIFKIIGMRELAACLRGECTLAEAATAMKQATRNYAKRQMTWFRHQLQPIWAGG